MQEAPRTPVPRPPRPPPPPSLQWLLMGTYERVPDVVFKLPCPLFCAQFLHREEKGEGWRGERRERPKSSQSYSLFSPRFTPCSWVKIPFSLSWINKLFECGIIEYDSHLGDSPYFMRSKVALFRLRRDVQFRIFEINGPIVMVTWKGFQMI